MDTTIVFRLTFIPLLFLMFLYLVDPLYLLFITLHDMFVLLSLLR